MPAKMTKGLICALLLPGVLPCTANGVEAHIFFIKNGEKTSLTGFRLKGTKGIVTALHGVTPNHGITAKSAGGLVFLKLRILKADVARDLAILSCPELEALPADGLDLLPRKQWKSQERVFVFGYPEPISVRNLVTALDVRPHRPFETLTVLVGPANAELLQKRTSPNPAYEVLSLNGFLLPGHSGAPILDRTGNDARVLAVGNGGLKGKGICWAIPLDQAELKPLTESDLPAQLRNTSTSFFSALGTKPAETDRGLDELKVQIMSLRSDFLQQTQELRELVCASMRERARVRDIHELKGLIEGHLDFQPKNASLVKIGARVKQIIENIEAENAGKTLPVDAQDALLQAKVDVYLSEGAPRKALEILTEERLGLLKKEAEKRHDAHATAAYQRANALQMLGDHKNAISAYKELLASQPAHRGAFTCLIASVLALNEHELALKYCETIIARHEADETFGANLSLQIVSAYSMCGEVLARQKKHELAIAKYDAALKRLVEMLDRDDYSGAVSTLNILTSKGVAWRELKKLEKSLETLEIAERLIPKIVKRVNLKYWDSFDAFEVWSQKAITLRHMGSLPEAIKTYDNVIQALQKVAETSVDEELKAGFDPIYQRFLNNRGYVHFLAKDNEAAINDWALSMEKCNRMLLLTKEDLLIQARVVEIPAVLDSLAWVLRNANLIAEKGKEEPGHARILDILDKNVAIWKARIEMGRLDRESCLAVYLGQRGMTRAKLGQREDALSDLKKAIEIMRRQQKAGEVGLEQLLDVLWKCQEQLMLGTRGGVCLGLSGLASRAASSFF
jgi:tetratricopeptide (TPR) repeat protein